MSLLIKGMEMPKSCSVCPMLEGESMDGLCHAANKWLDDDEHWTWYVYPEGDVDDSKPCNCPLIEVPPHGDLIDKDALMDAIENTDWYHQAPNKEMVHGANSAEHQAWYKIQDIYAAIDNAPTIIQAEEKDKT